MTTSRRRSRPGCQAGFTLIELMLAMAILAMILTLLASAIHGVNDSKSRLEGRMWTDREGRAALLQLGNEIRGAILTRETPSNTLLLGTASFTAGAATNSISISTIDPGHRRAIDGFGAEEIVAYRLVPNPQHKRWYLLERTQQSALNAQGGSAPVSILANNVLSLTIHYFDGNEWSEVWNSQNMARNEALPTAVAIDLRLAAPGGHEMAFATQVTVPMAISQW